MRVLPPPDYQQLISRTKASSDLVRIFVAARQRPPSGYPPWDKVKHLKPPENLSHEEWWTGIKLARAGELRPLPLVDAPGDPFSYALPDAVLRLLHFVDQRCAGEVAMEEVVTTDAQARQRYLVNSLMEEAIRSSQLEGATTSRQLAKELLRSGRAPRDRSERMILNNYRALNFMREQAGDRLTPALVLELQRIVTEGTLDDPDTAGRLQRPGEERVVVLDRDTGETLHVPPPAVQLPERLRAMCDFANEVEDGERFIHPVVRGILLHFWLAYDHPFVDGNGRTARALFYWYLRTRGYWLVEYLSISRILRNAPSKYAQSFLHTEVDGNDATYFLLYQLEVIERAVKELHAYLRRKMGEVRDVEQLIADERHFNHRQLALLGDALRHAGRTYTIGAHATTHRVTHETARTDVTKLADRGLLERGRAGRTYVFTAPPDLDKRLRRG
jgi:Fic family protein